MKANGDILEITTEVYQAKNGGIFLNWGNTTIKLSEDDANVVADGIPSIDRDSYQKFYNTI